MPVEIVAEIGASHGQDLDRARALCRGAIDAGSDCVKLQCYTPDTISHPLAGVCPSGPWKGRPLYDLYREAHLPRDLFRALVDWLKVEGIPWFSATFSAEDTAFLRELGCPRFKVSGFEGFGFWMQRVGLDCYDETIVSGSSDLWPAPPSDLERFIALRCVSDYPADPLDYGLAECPPAWPERLRWGLSDHTTTPLAGIIAIAKGACMIERHVKLDGDTATPDAGFATPLAEFRVLVRTWREAEAVATSARRPPSPLASLRPQPVEVDGAVRWLRLGEGSRLKASN